MSYTMQDKINQILGVNQKTDEQRQVENYQKLVNNVLSNANQNSIDNRNTGLYNAQSDSKHSGSITQQRNKSLGSGLYQSPYTAQQTRTSQAEQTERSDEETPKKKGYNPFLKKDGSLVNKYIDYESLYNSDKTNAYVKQWITEATGIGAEDTEEISEDSEDDAVDEQPIADTSGGKLGFISAKYETGGYDGGLVSSGSGDYGGISYGIPQFSTTTGSANNFVKWLKSAYPDMGSYFGSATAGSAEFGNAWKTVYQKFGDKFSNAQTSYAYSQFVQPLVNLAKQKTGVDYTRSSALKELIFSTAIQFGGGSLGLRALGNVNSGMSDTDIINASYDTKIANYKSFFKSSSASVQESVRNRFVNERNDVLALVGKGGGTTTASVSRRRRNSRRRVRRKSASSGGSSKGQSLVNTAKKFLGTQYVWGGTSPSGFDCSGLMQYAAAQNGISVPRTTYDQIKGGKAVDKNNLQPGDFVFFGTASDPHHVGMYIGNGQYIHSPKTGDVVKISNLSGRGDFVGARRYT